MGPTQLTALRNLIQRLPLPLVLIDNLSGTGWANDRFAELFVPGQLANPELLQLALNPGDAWQSAKLRRQDGRNRVAWAQAHRVVDGVLLVFDEIAGQILIQENERLRARIAALETLTATDPLTGTWNRVQLERMIDVEISRATRSGQPVTLVLLDIDSFKRVNDAHGHLAGDAVLHEFVGRIRDRMRDTDSLFRWGGDEFVLLATSVGYRGGAALAEGLRRAIATTPFVKVGSITASLGVTEYMEGETAEQWFQRTDRALYAAKAAGRDRLHVDRQGCSDLHATRAGEGVLRLYWLEAYECGEPTIDAEHRALFDLGNALITTAIDPHSEPGSWRAALDTMLAHLARHFQAEEALLEQHGYGRLGEHRSAHAGLLQRAEALRAAVETGNANLSHLVNFVVNDVIALHVLKNDRDFYLLLRSANSGGKGRSRP